MCRFPAFPSHLPKVRNRPGPSVAPVPAFPFPSASSHLPKVRGFPAFSSHLPKVRNLPRPSVAPVPAFSFPAASSHLPKVCRFPAFSSHLPKVRNRQRPSVAPVPAFPFPAAFSHLPKVCSFPAFSTHLPKVCKSRIASRRSVVAFVPFMTSSPSEGAGRNGILPPPSHFRYVPIRIGGGSRRSCQVPCRGGDGEKPHPSAPFLQHWIQSASTGLLSGPVPVTQLEGADQSAVSHPPSWFRYKPAHFRGTSYQLCPSCPSVSLPQRQQIPRFGAVVEVAFSQHPCSRPSGRHCPSVSMSQRQQIPRIGAVVEVSFLQYPCYRPSGRHCLSVSLPQRQQKP